LAYQKALISSQKLGAVVASQSQSREKNIANVVAPAKESDYKSIASLVSAMEQHAANLETIDNIADKVCQADGRHALNIERRSCERVIADNM
jgi:hypothetical protein